MIDGEQERKVPGKGSTKTSSLRFSSFSRLLSWHTLALSAKQGGGGRGETESIVQPHPANISGTCKQNRGPQNTEKNERIKGWRRHRQIHVLSPEMDPHWGG